MIFKLRAVKDWEVFCLKISPQMQASRVDGFRIFAFFANDKIGTSSTEMPGAN